MSSRSPADGSAGPATQHVVALSASRTRSRMPAPRYSGGSWSRPTRSMTAYSSARPAPRAVRVLRRSASLLVRPSRIASPAAPARCTSGSWVTMRTVTPSSELARRTPKTEAEVSVSSSPVGSSANRTAGRLASATAIATRCCSPPDSPPGRRPAQSPRRARRAVRRGATRRSLRRGRRRTPAAGPRSRRPGQIGQQVARRLLPHEADHAAAVGEPIAVPTSAAGPSRPR